MSADLRDSAEEQIAPEVDRNEIDLQYQLAQLHDLETRLRAQLQELRVD